VEHSHALVALEAREASDLTAKTIHDILFSRIPGFHEAYPR
jgi:hypothetical protein